MKEGQRFHLKKSFTQEDTGKQQHEATGKKARKEGKTCSASLPWFTQKAQAWALILPANAVFQSSFLSPSAEHSGLFSNKSEHIFSGPSIKTRLPIGPRQRQVQRERENGKCERDRVSTKPEKVKQAASTPGTVPSVKNTAHSSGVFFFLAQ